MDRSHLRLAETGGRFYQSVEHDLKIEGRAADGFEDVGGGGLLSQGLAQLVKQPHVLDRDDGLRCEVLYQGDLFLGERPDFLAVVHYGADQFVVLKHRHGDESSRAAKLGGWHWDGGSGRISRVVRLLGQHDALKQAARYRLKGAAPPLKFGKFRWSPNFCYEVKCLAVEAMQHA